MNRFFQKLLFILITAVVMTAGVVVVVAVNNRGAAPVLWLKMDEGYGSTTADTSGYSNNGIIVAGYWKNESDCKQGKCLYFDGSDDYLNCGNGATLDFSQYVTVEAWVKPASLLGAGQYNNIVSFEGSNMALMLTDSGKVGFWLQDNSPGNWHYILTDNAETATDSWYHIAAAYDGSRQRLYINGVEKKTGSVDSFTINTLNQALYIGNTGGELDRKSVV